MPVRRIPLFPPPPFTRPYRCSECGKINWLTPRERPKETVCLHCGAKGKLEEESLLDHIFPEI